MSVVKETYKDKEYTILVEPDLEDGGYVVECLDIPGCLSRGDTRDSAIENIKDAIRECQAVLRKKERAVKAHHGWTEQPSSLKRRPYWTHWGRK